MAELAEGEARRSINRAEIKHVLLNMEINIRIFKYFIQIWLIL